MKIIDNIINMFKTTTKPFELSDINDKVLTPTDKMPVEEKIEPIGVLSPIPTLTTIAIEDTPLNGWKTIETAPKNGRKVLLYQKGGQAVAYWNEMDGLWKTSKEGYFPNPTHWKYLDNPFNTLVM